MAKGAKMVHSGNREVSRTIRTERQALAKQIVAQQYGLQPEEWATYGDVGWEKSVRDAGYHLAYLAEAIAASDPSLFVDYVAWVRTLFASLGFGEDVLPITLQCTREVLDTALSHPAMDIVTPYINAGLQGARSAPLVPVPMISDDAPLFELARAYLDALLQGERRTASRLILDAAERGTSIKDVYLYVFQPTQREVGRLWQLNRASVAQEHYCTAATQLIMSLLYPRIFGTERRGRTLVAACVGGELHEIGVRMVADFFEMDGWDTYYLGANTPTEAILKTLDERRADVLAISATMTFHVNDVADLIARVRKRKHEHTSTLPHILVGGYPFLVAPDLWRQVGADGSARNAQDAIATANALMDK
jgi:methanogenic corrinoid protein MtbC1